ncbi:hypothetical protein SESBI_02030 [Sesbania bispinosa]|nr:hypothetical protein SESBI_02030 [Sesbania bispinosa]
MLLMECSARVSPSPTRACDELSTQEEDLLDRSKKKHKVASEMVIPQPEYSEAETPSSETIVVETPLGDQAEVLPRPSKGNMGVKFQTATRMGLERKVEHGKGEEVESEFFEDPLCSVVRLSEAESDAIRIPWQRSILVKLLGKRMSLRFFQARLYKIWQPRARMEVIDLDNEYFVIRFEILIIYNMFSTKVRGC